MIKRLLCLLLLLSPATALAQASGLQEVVVTATRNEAFSPGQPAVGLTRIADYAVQEVVIAGDTRDEAKRHDEIFAMVRGAIDLAQKRGIELATGEAIVEPLTAANYRNLTLKSDGRPDTDRTVFLVKTKLGGGVDAKAALDRIDAFIKDVPSVGRAEMKPSGDLTLSVIGPDQYRGAIIDLVAADARATAAKLGPDYAVEVKGLDRGVEWSRASLTEVLLYLPYSYTVVPKAR
jgi:hypothetical protein